MKFIITVIFLLGIFWLFIGQTMLTQKACYDTAETRIENVNKKVMLYGEDKRYICEQQFIILSDLETCVNESIGNGKLSEYKEKFSDVLISYIRPLTNIVEGQQTQHDSECSDYTTLLFSTPK